MPDQEESLELKVVGHRRHIIRQAPDRVVTIPGRVRSAHASQVQGHPLVTCAQESQLPFPLVCPAAVPRYKKHWRALGAAPKKVKLAARPRQELGRHERGRHAFV